MKPPALKSQFEGLSRSDLQSAMLHRLSEKANLQSESRHLRDRLSTIRSALAAIEHEIKQIQFFISIPNLLGFPKTVQPKLEAELVRTYGRWGKVTFEPVPSSTPIATDLETASPRRYSRPIRLKKVARF